MESFSLLKYWKSSSGGPPPPTTTTSAAATPAAITTIVTAINDHDSDAGGDDDGPFFDLEFALPTTEDDEDGKDGDDQVEVHHINDDAVDVDVGEEEDEDVPNMSFSPSDDLVFKGRILGIDGQEEDVIDSGNVKSVSGQFPIPVSLAKSATKFRVFLLGLKRSKSESKPQNPPQNPPQNIHRNNANANANAKKMFTVKFKVEEVPIFSLLTRASSNSKNNSNSSNANEDEQPQVQQQQQQQKLDSSVTNSEGSGDEKKNKKEVVQKYLKMVKPLYVKVSKKSQKEATEKTGQKQGLNLKVIAKKHLVKSKSAVVHSMEQNTTSSSSSKKRDDSLFQQQDGIQSAILHCKRSFNSSSTDGEEASSAVAEVAVEEENDVVASKGGRPGRGKG